MPSSTAVTNCLTIDVEEWYHSAFLNRQIPPAVWDDQPSIAQPGVERVLRLLDRYQTRATFFILGYVAARNPSLCARIAREGHEVATHGYWHGLVAGDHPDDFREDVLMSIEAIQEATGCVPRGYRAPVASLTYDTLWAFDVMRDLGIVYDSSVYPTRNLVFAGMPDAPRTPYTVRGVKEVPLSVADFCGVRVPFSGGFYLRAFPFRLYRRFIRQENQANRPAIIYLHPWEFHHDFPRVARNLAGRIVHYTNLESTEPRLCKLLDEFRWGAIEDVVFPDLPHASATCNP